MTEAALILAAHQGTLTDQAIVPGDYLALDLTSRSASRPSKVSLSCLSWYANWRYARASTPFACGATPASSLKLERRRAPLQRSPRRVAEPVECGQRLRLVRWEARAASWFVLRFFAEKRHLFLSLRSPGQRFIISAGFDSAHWPKRPEGCL